jgi:anti-sigma factor ChrR (cupin superfamily)
MSNRNLLYSADTKLRFLLCLVLLGAATAQARQDASSDQTGAKPILLTPSDLKWMPAPIETGIPSAVQIAVLSGDPSKTGLFTVRLKIPDGGKIAPHWHPTDEYVTVLEGTFAAGMGDKFDEAGLRDFPSGSYALMPKGMHHFATAKGETVVQVHAMGPFVLNYVNPADDPRKK